MSKEQILGITRAVLAAVGGYFVAQGIVDHETVTQVSGALVTVVAAVWSVLSKRT